MNKTKIEWCDSTWNPITGCNHGCEYCYARRIANRFGTQMPDGSGHPEKHGGIHCVENKIKNNPYPYLFEPTFLPYRLEEPARKTKPQTIFVCSMADMFGDWVPDSWIEEIFVACEKAPQHRYLFLTKNPKRYIDLAKSGKLPAKDNMWYGTTATTPNKNFFWGGAWHTFVSIEPILRDYSQDIEYMCDTFAQWVIVGAETGNRIGKVTPKKEWIDAITKTCLESNISLFIKESLLPIVGEENMFREFPWDINHSDANRRIDRKTAWLNQYYKKLGED